MVSIEEFGSIDLRVGRIIEVKDHEGARKPMYVLKVDLGELGLRTIVAGIRDIYKKEELEGTSIVVVANLDPKGVAGITSEGMLLAAEDNGQVVLIRPDKDIAPGSRIH
ncbi:MAG: tRNA-binding protein [Candidatus Marsarchaeota archaeon]|jgi:methionyl-tRNA synthetase|nr:tRNA-binding protein [Candidatus Marsarchaeota archaeon]MCL5418816.1 tRNA-binding protein [Candidatus Marsarchaeota archaeon]